MAEPVGGRRRRRYLRHRRPRGALQRPNRVSIADLIVAAAAMSAQLTVVHYDRHFETIAEAVPLQHRRVAERGALA